MSSSSTARILRLHRSALSLRRPPQQRLLTGSSRCNEYTVTALHGWSSNITISTISPAFRSPLQHQRQIRIRSFASSKAAESIAAVNLEEEEEEDDSKNKAPSPSLTKAYLDLAKARLSLLVVTTTAAGFIAAGGPISSQSNVLGAVTMGTFLCSASAAALNQIFEVDRDRQMKRTQHRPLVTGVMSKQHAMTAAATWGVAGSGLLVAGTDPVTTALGVGNIALYAGLYTYTKPISIYNTWIGAVVGAIPPVMGWTAATGGSVMDVEALLLGSTLYLWQMPHFFALSFMHRVDYKRGGFQMVPCLERDGEKTAGIIVRYAYYLALVPFAATLTNVTSSMFALEGVALNAYALYVAHKFQRERTNANARKIFLTSLWYLPCLLMLFLLHSKVWDKDQETQDDAITKVIADQIHSIRDKGREMCPHEAAVAKTDHGENACPVTVGTKTSRKGVEAASAAVTATANNVTSSLQETKTNSSDKV